MIDAVGTSSAETLFSVCPVVFGTPVDVGAGVGKSVDHVVPISGPSFDVDASRGSTVNDSVGTWRSQAVTRVIIVRFTLQPPSLVHDDAMSVVYVQSDSEFESLAVPVGTSSEEALCSVCPCPVVSVCEFVDVDVSSVLVKVDVSSPEPSSSSSTPGSS